MSLICKEWALLSRFCIEVGSSSSWMLIYVQQIPFAIFVKLGSTMFAKQGLVVKHNLRMLSWFILSKYFLTVFAFPRWSNRRTRGYAQDCRSTQVPTRQWQWGEHFYNFREWKASVAEPPDKTHTGKFHHHSARQLQVSCKSSNTYLLERVKLKVWESSYTLESYY